MIYQQLFLIPFYVGDWNLLPIDNKIRADSSENMENRQSFFFPFIRDAFNFYGNRAGFSVLSKHKQPFQGGGGSQPSRFIRCLGIQT